MPMPFATSAVGVALKPVVRIIRRSGRIARSFRARSVPLGEVIRKEGEDCPPAHDARPGRCLPAEQGLLF